MKNNKLTNLMALAIISLCLGIATINSNNKTCVAKSDNTRDYAYERYCDSIYAANPDYYLDVLVETDKFQSYLNEHGKWWDN